MSDIGMISEWYHDDNSNDIKQSDISHEMETINLNQKITLTFIQICEDMSEKRRNILVEW